MGRKKNKSEDEILDEYFMEVLEGKHIPLLTLDVRWHSLFPDHRKNSEIKKLEKELNTLIKKQGQTENDLKDYAKTKKILMKNIVDNMTDGHEYDSPIRSKKQDANQKLMLELKDKIAEAEAEKRQFPEEISRANRRLLLACMRACYQELMENTEIIEAEEEIIIELREEIKDHILIKQDREMRNTEVYKYMHNLLGAEVVEIFDREHQVWKGNMEETKLEE